MKSLATGICTAAALALSLAAFAQQPQPQPAPSQPPSAQQPAAQPPASAEQPITLTGCVQSEEDYRKAKGMAKGGAASTGVGVGNEFVIINAKPAGAAAPGTSETAGTTGAAAQAYEVTGSMEGDLKQFVGKRVEITGKTKAAERSASGAPTGGVDPAGQDLKLAEIEIAAVKAVPGECKPM
jgi:hypothetical protein